MWEYKLFGNRRRDSVFTRNRINHEPDWERRKKKNNKKRNANEISAAICIIINTRALRHTDITDYRTFNLMRGWVQSTATAAAGSDL